MGGRVIVAADESRRAGVGGTCGRAVATGRNGRQVRGGRAAAAAHHAHVAAEAGCGEGGGQRARGEREGLESVISFRLYGCAVPVIRPRQGSASFSELVRSQLWMVVSSALLYGFA